MGFVLSGGMVGLNIAGKSFSFGGCSLGECDAQGHWEAWAGFALLGLHWNRVFLGKFAFCTEAHPSTAAGSQVLLKTGRRVMELAALSCLK